MRNWRDLRIGLLPLVLCVVVFSAVGFARSAQAQYRVEPTCEAQFVIE